MIIDKEINFCKLQQEIALLYPNIEGISAIGNEYTFHGLSGNEDLTEIIENHTAFDLYELKESRFNEIDKRTVEIISAGFVFDGQTFSLSVQAQNNWTNIKANKELFNSIGSFPMDVSTKDSNIYVLNYADVDSFWSAGMIAVKTPYAIGGLLKKLIFDSASIAECELIIDNR